MRVPQGSTRVPPRFDQFHQVPLLAGFQGFTSVPACSARGDQVSTKKVPPVLGVVRGGGFQGSTTQGSTEFRKDSTRFHKGSARLRRLPWSGAVN